MSNEGNPFIPGEGLDNHGCGMKSLEPQVPPSDGLSVIMGKSLPADFCLGLHYSLVEFLKCLGVKGFQKKGVHYGIPFGYVLGDDLEALSSYGRHPVVRGLLPPPPLWFWLERRILIREYPPHRE